jgi:hypothetical protein
MSLQHLSAILTIFNMKHKHNHEDIQRQTFSMIQCMMAGVRMNGVMTCKAKRRHCSSGADPDPVGLDHKILPDPNPTIRFKFLN